MLPANYLLAATAAAAKKLQSQSRVTCAEVVNPYLVGMIFVERQTALLLKLIVR